MRFVTPHNVKDQVTYMKEEVEQLFKDHGLHMLIDDDVAYYDHEIKYWRKKYQITVCNCNSSYRFTFHDLASNYHTVPDVYSLICSLNADALAGSYSFDDFVDDYYPDANLKEYRKVKASYDECVGCHVHMIAIFGDLGPLEEFV